MASTPHPQHAAPMKLLLVDGHYYLYRSFYAIRGLRNSAGHPSNAIFAFAKALRKMLADVAPTHGAVLWDTGLPERRVALQPQYKQQRPEMPEDLECQEQPVIELCPLLGLRSIRVAATEADDLIAADAKAAPPGTQVVIATSDKDILQLATESVRIYSTSKADLGTAEPGATHALLGPEEVAAKRGVPAAAIADVLSLTGDASDNIPGVSGVGEKTAVGLIRQFGSVEELLAGLDRVPHEKLRSKLADAAPQMLARYPELAARHVERWLGARADFLKA